MRFWESGMITCANVHLVELRSGLNGISLLSIELHNGSIIRSIDLNVNLVLRETKKIKRERAGEPKETSLKYNHVIRSGVFGSKSVERK